MSDFPSVDSLLAAAPDSTDGFAAFHGPVPLVTWIALHPGWAITLEFASIVGCIWALKRAFRRM